MKKVKDAIMARLLAGMLAGHLFGWADPRWEEPLTELMENAIKEARRLVAARTN